MARRPVELFSVDPDACKGLEALCDACNLQPEKVSYTSCRVPYVTESSAFAAVVFAPAVVPDPKHCLPVIPLKLSRADVLAAVEQTGLSGRAVSVLLPRRMLRFDGSEAEARRLSWFFTEDYPTAAAAAAEAGRDADVLAGLAPLAPAAEKAGLTFLRLLPDARSIAASVDEAKEIVHRLLLAETEKIRENAYAKSVPGGFIEVDAEGCIVQISERAKMMLGYHGAMIDGRYILNIFPQLDRNTLDAALIYGFSISAAPAGNRKRSFLVSLEPIAVEEKVTGAVIYFTPQRNPSPASEGDTPHSTGAFYRFSMLEYRSATFQYLMHQAVAIANTSCPLLLRGEEGTEVSQLAQCIHNASLRENRRFAEVECNAWSPEQIRHILFDTIGPGTSNGSGIKSYEGGTLFFNHIERLPIDLQFDVYLLITGSYRPDNELGREPIDVRVIAATGCNLRQLVLSGAFREDLYYALNTVSLNLPSLRERKEDIPCLVSYFLRKYSEEFDKRVSLSNGALTFLHSYEWPGNIRQMDTYFRKLLLLTPHKSISEAFVRQMMAEQAAPHDARADAMDEKNEKRKTMEPEARQILEALEKNHGNKTKTAAMLGFSKVTLWRRMQKYGILGGEDSEDSGHAVSKS